MKFIYKLKWNVMGVIQFVRKISTLDSIKKIVTIFRDNLWVIHLKKHKHMQAHDYSIHFKMQIHLDKKKRFFFLTFLKIKKLFFIQKYDW